MPLVITDNRKSGRKRIAPPAGNLFPVPGSAPGASTVPMVALCGLARGTITIKRWERFLERKGAVPDRLSRCQAMEDLTIVPGIQASDLPKLARARILTLAALKKATGEALIAAGISQETAGEGLVPFASRFSHCTSPLSVSNAVRTFCWR